MKKDTDDDHAMTSAVELLYQSVTDNSVFPSAIANVGTLADSNHATLVWVNGDSDGPVAAEIVTSEENRINKSWDAYSAYYHQFDPTVSAWESVPEGGWFVSSRNLSSTALARSPFVNDFVLANGFGSWATLKIKGGSGNGALALHRDVGMGTFSPKNLQRVELVAPHLRRVLQLRDSFAELRQMAAAGLGILNTLALPIWIVDSNYTIRFANRAAETSEVATRYCMHKKLQLHDHPAEFSRLIANACDPVAKRGGALRLTDTAGRRHLVHVLPLPPHLAVADACTRPLAIVLSTANAGTTAGLGRLLAMLFGFTAAETRIAAALLADLTLEEMAAQWQVKVSTVRMQIKSMLSKADCRRQVELMRVLANLALVSLHDRSDETVPSNH